MKSFQQFLQYIIPGQTQETQKKSSRNILEECAKLEDQLEKQTAELEEQTNQFLQERDKFEVQRSKFIAENKTSSTAILTKIKVRPNADRQVISETIALTNNCQKDNIFIPKMCHSKVDRDKAIKHLIFESDQRSRELTRKILEFEEAQEQFLNDQQSFENELNHSNPKTKYTL